MAIAYTITVTEDLVTLQFSGNEVNLDEEDTLLVLPEILNLRTNTIVDILAMNHVEQTLIFKVTEDAEFKLYIQETAFPNDFFIEVFLINIYSLAAGNLLNKKDVNKIIKMSSLYNSSKVIDSLNRIVIAKHRTSVLDEEYAKVNTILELIESVADNNCEEC